MNRNHQSQNTKNHTPAGREHVARKQMGSSMRTPSSFNPKELQRTTYQRSSGQKSNSIPEEKSYQAWMSGTDEQQTNYDNYRSDGPGPVEIEAREKYTHEHLNNPAQDLHGRNFSYRAQSEMYQGIGPKGYVRSDERVQEDVCEMLTQDRHIDASSIYVGVENGIAKLTGTVKNRQEKFAIEDAVEAVPGVNEVFNDIKVQR